MAIEVKGKEVKGKGSAECFQTPMAEVVGKSERMN